MTFVDWRTGSAVSSPDAQSCVAGSPRGVRTCAGKVCVIEITPRVKAGLAQTFLATKDTLTKKYGAPESGKRNVLPGDCASALPACLESGRATLEFVWRFPGSESINLSIGKESDQDALATMRLRYSVRPTTVRVNAEGL